MTKRFVKVYTTDSVVPSGEMLAIPKNSILRHRPKRVPKFRIPKPVKSSLFAFDGIERGDDWNHHATRDEFKTHFKKLFGSEVESMGAILDEDICSLTIYAYARAFINARKVEKAQLRKDPTLGHHPDTYSKKLELITSVYGESGAKFYLVIHDLVIDYIAARI